MFTESYQLWEDREDVKLYTFLHSAGMATQLKKPRPAIIICPGGAYFECGHNNGDGDPIAYSFCADGYQSFVLEYSVAARAPQEKTLFPAQLLDLGKAILLIREHAEEWCVDVDKISVIGFSAGGHLCAMLGTTWHTGLLSDYFHVDASLFKPLCVLSIYGVLDYVRAVEVAKPEEDFFTHVLGSKRPDVELLKQHSPVYLVNENTPPFFIAAARDDFLVPAIESIDMAQALHNAKRPYELHIFENGDHGFCLGRDPYEPWKLESTHACAAWVPLAKTFLMHQISPETAENEKEVFGKLAASMPNPAVKSKEE